MKTILIKFFSLFLFLHFTALTAFQKCHAVDLIQSSVFSNEQNQESQNIKSSSEEQTPLLYPNIEINEILNIYQRMTGKRLIKDVNLQGRISIISPQPVARDQAIKIIEAALSLNGVNLVPMPEENAVKVIPTGKSPRADGLPFYTSAAALPAGDMVVDFYMPLQFISTSEAVGIFTSYLQGSTTAQIVPVQNTQALIVTEKASSIRRLIEVKKQIDIPPAKVISEFVTLERADAERVVQIITRILENRAQSNPGGNPDMPEMSSFIGQSERSLVAGHYRLVPDARTNRIFVSARPVSFPYIKKLILEFDKSIQLVPPLEYPLKYIAAGEILPLLQSTLNEDSNGESLISPTIIPTSSTPSNMGSGANDSGLMGSESLSPPGADTAPASITIGKTRIIADKKANSILVMGSPEIAEKVKTILDALDKRPQQVYLSTIIGELSLRDGEEFGVDLLQQFKGGQDGKSGAASSFRTTDTKLTDPVSLSSLAALAANTAAGMTIYGKIAGDLNLYVKALESSNRFKVISRPVIYTINNKKATISSGRQIAVPTQTLTSVTGDSVPVSQSNIQFKDIVLKLDVVPLINANREVTLDILQTADDEAGTTTISGNQIPNISTKLLKTTVSVQSGSAVVLGGLISDRTNKDVIGIPILSDIPLIGNLFKDTKLRKDRSELIIMIQPVVVSTPDETLVESNNELDRSQMKSVVKRVYTAKPENSIQTGKKPYRHEDLKD